MLEPRLPSTSHVCQDRLPEVPSQKLIDWSLGFVQEFLIEMLTSKVSRIKSEEYNFVIILEELSAAKSLQK
jgi:hypothetical protein